MKPDSNTSPLTVQSSQPLYFDCSMCGDCCSSWNIPIEGDKARALLEKPWVLERLKASRRELVRVNHTLYRLPLNDENFCVFLAEDGRCLVEANEGIALKPTECQRFPFSATVKLPDGRLRQDTSAACKHIAEKLLLAFQPIEPRPDAVKERPSADETGGEKRGKSKQTKSELETLPRKIPVNHWFFRWVPLTRLSFEAYNAYQESLRELFDNAQASPSETLQSAWHLLKNKTGKLDISMIAQLVESASKERKGFSGKRAQALTLIFLRKPYQTFSWLELLRGKAYNDPWVLSVPVDLKQQAAVRWDPSFDRQVNAYLYNFLNRKVLLARGESLKTQLVIAGVACLLVQWYAKTLAWLKNQEVVEAQDVSSAIRLVERYYTGHQPRFLNIFASPWKSWLVSRILF